MTAQQQTGLVCLSVSQCCLRPPDTPVLWLNVKPVFGARVCAGICLRGFVGRLCRNCWSGRWELSVTKQTRSECLVSAVHSLLLHLSLSVFKPLRFFTSLSSVFDSLHLSFLYSARSFPLLCYCDFIFVSICFNCFVCISLSLALSLSVLIVEPEEDIDKERLRFPTTSSLACASLRRSPLLSPPPFLSPFSSTTPPATLTGVLSRFFPFPLVHRIPLSPRGPFPPAGLLFSPSHALRVYRLSPRSSLGVTNTSFPSAHTPGTHNTVWRANHRCAIKDPVSW